MIATDDAIFAFISPGYYQVGLCSRLTYRPNINNSRPNHCNLPSFSNPTCIACNDAKFTLISPGYKINSSAHSTIQLIKNIPYLWFPRCSLPSGSNPTFNFNE